MRNKRVLRWVILLVLSLPLLTACGGAAATPTVAPTATFARSAAPASTVPSASAAPSAPFASAATPTRAAGGATPVSTAGALAHTDATGTAVSFARPIERIVCLPGPCIDIAIELGMKPVGSNPKRTATHPGYYGENGVDGITFYAGTFDEPNLEEVAKLKPDVVIGLAGTAHEKLRDALKPIAPLIILSVRTPEEAYDNLRAIGRLTNRTAEAEAAITKTRDRLASYAAKSPKNLKALQITGSGTFFTIAPAPSLYGGSLAQVTAYPWPIPAGANPNNIGNVSYSLEKILEVNPDVIFVADLDADFGGPTLVKGFESNPVWKNINAVKNGRVYQVGTVVWANNRGTRALRLQLDEALPLLYPQVFPSPLPAN